MGGKKSTGPGSEELIRGLIGSQLAPDEVLLEGIRFSDPRHGDVEADFLVLIPGSGIAIIEVKGGTVTYSNGQWQTSYGNVIRRINPVDQARRAKHALRRYLDRQPEWNHGLIRSDWFVVMPFTEIVGDMSTEARRDLMIGKSDLDQLMPNIRTVLNSTLNNDDRPDADDIDLALSLLLRKRVVDETAEGGKPLLRKPLAWTVIGGAVALATTGFFYFTRLESVPDIQQTSNQQNPSGCDPNYQPCIPIDVDLSCSDIKVAVQVVGADIHDFDRDSDGLGCEVYQ